ncbi:hypothetical protein GNI_126510 [Gregarina niphandrodes]|uniref:Uncharacterized protein n=1 Tax=Gregarina niphandrodes TaxID=110365 RepID=A0A023B1Z7_GRENI|nr:hypothetical protein GNI_126510 [Gregarina niphandrodes]EZG50022.1 hypothetical protein GNI_126510 [Gregarina niphandrodes]|eukprot:XP_011132026.1 hypothetical protein GNI_126510 [Gregarina niphandrodes]
MFKKQNDPTSPVNSLAVDTSMQTADDTFPPSSNATDDIIKSQDQSQDQAQDQSQDQAQDQSQDQAQDQSQDQAPKDETGLPRLETGPRVYHTLYVHGFVDSCVRQKNCVANHKSMIPELFDGLYEMYSITGMDSLQSLDEVTSFNTFPSFNLVYKRLSLDKADLEAEQKWSRLYKDTLPELYLTLEHRRGSPGLDLKITAETPLSTTKHLSAASHPPFATLSDTCDNNDVAQCHNSHWLLQSAATYGCTSGVRFEGSCYYPAKISVLPASVEIETTS